jgi:nitrogen fixation/metabolism regulation signal transduction histidine kinase
MMFKRFHFAVTIRALLMAVNCLLIAFVGLRLHLVINAVMLSMLLAAQVWELIRYVERSNRDVARFLTGLRQDDLSQSFRDDDRGGSHGELRRELAEAIALFRKTRSEREEDFHYLSTAIKHVEIGLIAVTDEGDVELVNPAARRCLGIGAARHVREIARQSPEMAAAIENIRPGARSLLKLDRTAGIAELALAATKVRIGARSLKLISLHDIARELDKRELEAWQQLARILSHEIANSIAPIASLATTARDQLLDLETNRSDDADYRLNAESFADLNEMIATIAKRSEGLVRFIEEYRRLTRLPPPRIRVVGLQELLERVRKLLLARPDIGSSVVKADVIPPTLELMADGELVEQALLNIGINALQALHDQDEGTIELTARLGDGGRTLIRVSDNGPGISEAALSKVFVPFFSTRSEGSGIGLSLARQIVTMHGGDIGVVSPPGGRTTFTLRF